MTNLRRAFLGLALIGAGVFGVEAALAQQSFTTANGLTVTLTDPGSLDCRALTRKLAEIDQTGYRRGPSPAAPRDMTLYQYEQQLAAQRYQACAQGASVRGGLRD